MAGEWGKEEGGRVGSEEEEEEEEEEEGGGEEEEEEEGNKEVALPNKVGGYSLTSSLPPISPSCSSLSLSLSFSFSISLSLSSCCSGERTAGRRG